MSLRALNRSVRPPLRRGQPCVCLVAGDQHQATSSALRSLLAHLDSRVPLVLAGARGPVELLERELEGLVAGRPDQRARVRASSTGPSPSAAVNSALEELAPADVALISQPCLVAQGWLAGLRAAALADSTAASSSALSCAGTRLALTPPDATGHEPGGGDRLGSEPPSQSTLDRRSASVAEHSLRLRPRIDLISGPAVYLRRGALELTGPLDEGLELAWALEVDFAQRCVLRGLCHVAADDVLVAALPSARAPGRPPPELLERYPHVSWPSRARASAVLPRALAAARRPHGRLSVTLDARSLGTAQTGTQVHVLGLIEALAGTGQITLRALVGAELDDEVHERLEALEDTRLLDVRGVAADTAPTEIFHRPQQAFGESDVDLMLALGQRRVITQLDLIAYRNPGYFPDPGAWEDFRRATRQGLSAADRVIVFSAHTLADLQADGLLDDARVRVVAPGLDHAPPPADDVLDRAHPPGGVFRERVRAPFLLCLGTDFRHKNRLFALALLEALRRDQGWEGSLVLAGTHVPDGSSVAEERRFLDERPALRGAVLDLGPVTETEKGWLIAGAAAVVYPSVYEGFGLVPFEAALAGVPCLFAAQSSLTEVLEPRLGTIVPWNVAETAPLARDLLDDGPARRLHVQAIREAASRLTWARAAEEIVAVYEEALVAPLPDAAAITADLLDRRRIEAELRKTHAEQLREVAQEREAARHLYWGLLEEVGLGRGLVGPRGSVPVELQRALLALSARPRIARALFGAAAAAYRGARALRRARS